MERQMIQPPEGASIPGWIAEAGDEMWIPGNWRSPTPNPGEHSDSQALCLPLLPLLLCALLPPRPTQVPRLHAGRLSPAALIKGALYPTLPGSGARARPVRHSSPFHTRAGHCRTNASVLCLHSPVPPTDPQLPIWAQHTFHMSSPRPSLMLHEPLLDAQSS